MSQPIVAAIQMTSLADVGMNLATARRLLVAARDRGACLAVLPENFSFMGRNEAERRRSPRSAKRSRHVIPALSGIAATRSLRAGGISAA